MDKNAPIAIALVFSVLAQLHRSWLKEMAPLKAP